MATKWGKRNGCKFASDAALRGDWLALHGLILQGSANADCPYPASTPVRLDIVTWAKRFNSNHPNQDLIKHDLKAEVSYGTPLLHQVVMAEGLANKQSYKPGLKLLLDNGADIDLQDKADGNTALHVACKLCRTTLIDYLLSRKANRKIENLDGEIATDLMPRWCKTVVKAEDYYNPSINKTSTNPKDYQDDEE